MDDQPRWGIKIFGEDHPFQDDNSVNMEANVNNFMNQNGVKPGFLEEITEGDIPNLEISMESTDNESSETSNVGHHENIESHKSPEVCDSKEINSKNDEKANFAENIKRRWGKKEDKMLWRTIRGDISNGLYTLEILKNIPIEEAKVNTLVIQLSKMIGWKTTNTKLLERIQKSISDNFSAREEILLRKLIKKKGYRNLDYDSILSNFPGKTKKRIVEVCENLCKAKK